HKGTLMIGCDESGNAHVLHTDATGKMQVSVPVVEQLLGQILEELKAQTIYQSSLGG
ncbi:hypothetical protein LCGC14_1842200, partial [marine sediment metagenome]